MGVPRLFPWIKKSFKNTVKYFFVGNYTNCVDYLYIDANGLLHTAAQRVYNYGSVERIPTDDPYATLNSDAKMRATFDVFFSLVCEVVKISPPSQSLFIAIDGPAPLAKQAQQRQRRFVSQTQRSKDVVFDSNCITPGTRFMFKLTQYLNFVIRKKMNSGEWPFEVCFSSALVPGEGEHKIVDYIRQLSKIQQTDARHCFFGLDADLIMLTLASQCYTIFLLREDQYNEGFYHSIDINSIRISLTWVFQESYPRIAVSDFLVVGFFVGNDFLPKIPMFLLLEDGLNFMIDARRRIGRSLTTSNGTIDVDGFTRFVKFIAAKEPHFLEQQATRKMPASRFVNHTLLRCVERGKLDYGRYRTAYYKKAGAVSQDKIDDMCRDYLQGILWVCAYYLQGLPSWEWCYTWHYAPLLGDLAEYLSRKSFSDIPLFVKGEPSLPFVQLLSVLPPQSSGLLPDAYRKLMNHPASPLVVKGVYPDSFSIDYEGKTKDHMGVALLSFVERDTIIEAYNTVQTTKTEGRNKKGVPVRFWVDPSFCSRFVSPFGSVARNRVRREKIVD